MIRKLSYRPDIDGLRALAVIAVIASHLPEKFLPSGFLGVDIFFAISGFVVTSSLLSQRRTRLSQLYVNFLARRIKRLMPALLVCVMITGFVVLATDPFPQHSIRTGLAALFGFANIELFTTELDYYAPSSKFNAFTHTWSLGVEEQFYIVFPLFAWFFFYRLKSISSKALPVAMIVGGLVSVALFAALYKEHQPAAFFLMPTRLWELGIGALIFLGMRRGQSEWLGKTLQRLAPFALVALFLIFFIPESYAVPATLAAVGLTGCLLGTNDRTLAWHLLVLPPVVYIGRISYSLYLWHWPIIALGPIVLPSAWRSSALYIVVMAIAAAASFHWVENPLRRRTWTTTRPRDIGLGLACNLVVGATLLFTMVWTEKASEGASNAVHPPAFFPLIGNDLPYESNCMIRGSGPLKADTVENCTVAPKTGSGMPTIWAMGDSHAGHLQGLLYEVHERLGVGVHLIGTPGWSYPFQGDGEYELRQQIFRRVSTMIEAGDIVLISRLYLSRSRPHSLNDLQPWLPRLSRFADELAEKKVSVVVTGPPPIFHYDDIRECNLDDRENCRVERAELSPLIDHVMEDLTILETNNSNIAVFNMFDIFCPPGEDYCYPDNGSSYLFRDKDHLNTLGSKILTESFVDLLRYSGALSPGN